MKLSKCESGHFYDADKYPECPYCNTALQKAAGGIVAASSVTGAGRAAQPDGPVTGWLVVLDGSAKGRDLRLGEGRSILGVDADGAPITLDANAPLGERLATLAYDTADGSFTLLPGTAQALCYLEQKSVLTPCPLKGGETLKLGEANLKFVPFCGDFKWQ